MESNIHERSTGVRNNMILDNIKRLSETGKEIIIRIPVIPGFNDDQANIEATGKFAASLRKESLGLPGVGRIDILPFNPGGKEKSARLLGDIKPVQIEAPGEEKMNSIAKELGKYGVEVKIGG